MRKTWQLRIIPMPSSHVDNGRTSEDISDLRIVAMLCLPSIIGTAFFLAGAIVQQVFGPGDAPPVEFGEPTAADRIKAAIGMSVFFTCYFGAAFGPVFLPFAVWPCVTLTRAAGRRSKIAVSAWILLILGLLAAITFWSWLIKLDLFI